MFIIEGVVTIGVACGAYFVLPNFPRTTMWLSEEERQLAVWRLEEDIGQDDWTDSKDQTFWHGAKLAFVDIKTYVLVRKRQPHLTPRLHLEAFRTNIAVLADGDAVLYCGQWKCH